MKNQGSNYNDVTKKTIIPRQAPPPQGKMTTNMQAKTYTCMLHAHFLNIATLGSYKEESNKVLKLNNLPEIKIPSTPPSHNFVSHFHGSGL